MYVPENVGLALILTTIAGLSTGIGGTIVYFIRKPRLVYLSFSLGFSAGVMIYLSFMELLPEAINKIGETGSAAVFFVGMFLMFFIDIFLPESENPHHVHEPTEKPRPCKKDALMRTGMFTALAIGIHNFPEGLATFAATLSSIKLGVIVALSIAIHNIPEGIAVAMPILYATGNRKKAFSYSFFSGLAEPIGGLICFIILMPFLTEQVLASVLAGVAGIMIYISLDQILPAAHCYGHEHTVISGIILGFAVMAVSLIIL